MLAVCLLLIAANVASVVSLTALLRSSQRAHARREDLLVNQLLHAAGRTWTPPPAEPELEAAPPPRDYTMSPEQHLYTNDF